MIVALGLFSLVKLLVSVRCSNTGSAGFQNRKAVVEKKEKKK